MSFQSDIAKYLDDELARLQMRMLVAAGIISPVGGDPVAAEKEDNDPVDAYEPRICEDGVIIRGPPSEDTPSPRRGPKE